LSRKLLDTLDNFSDKRAFAGGRAWLQIVFVQAISRTIVAALKSLLKYGTLVEIGKQFGIQGKGGSTTMVEKKEPCFQGFKVCLVSDNLYIGVAEKIVPCFPFVLAV
jgi:hypothetical protein